MILSSPCFSKTPTNSLPVTYKHARINLPNITLGFPDFLEFWWLQATDAVVMGLQPGASSVELKLQNPGLQMQVKINFVGKYVR